LVGGVAFFLAFGVLTSILNGFILMVYLFYDDQYVSEAIEQVNGVFLSSAAHVPSNADMTTFIPFIFSEQTLAKIS
jgi:hypothetical protein